MTLCRPSTALYVSDPSLVCRLCLQALSISKMVDPEGVERKHIAQGLVDALLGQVGESLMVQGTAASLCV